MNEKNSNDGQTLLGVLIALAIFSILGQALLTLTTTTFRTTSFNKSRIAARHLAQEQIELIRNLPYDSVGTTGGIPPGNLEQSQDIIRNGLNYTINTSIVYVDDTFDDIAPTDLLPTDYKRIRVSVSWGGISQSGKAPVVLVTDIAPKGVETTAGGGTLSILVFDANALPVPQADVTIDATTLNPPIQLELQTNNEGRIILPGSPVCTNCYNISVTKAGFSQDRTYSTSEVSNPAKPFVSILEGEITEISFAIDQLSTINFATLGSKENGFLPLPSASFRLRGEKIIGTDINDLAVYKYDNNITTNSGGLFTENNLEWDNYTILSPTIDNYDIAGSNPFLPFLLLPNTEIDVALSLVTHTANSLLATFIDGENAIASASVTLSGQGAPDIKSTGSDLDPDFGQVFFSDLESAIYNIEATASGFLDFLENVTVSGYTVQTYVLNSI